MISHRLAILGALLFTADPAPAQTPAPPAAVGCLASPTPGTAAIPYQPQPGDIVVSDDFNRFYHFVFKFADTAPPTHAAIVFAGVDGKPTLLDLTGPSLFNSKVTLFDIESRLQTYPGVIQVRRLRQPLTPEQSQELTKFAHAQEGKGFAIGRIVLMVTPACPRHGLRQSLFGHTYLDRKRWFCSEMVVAACAKSGLLDARSCRANAIYPRDLAVDERLDLSHLYHPPQTWTAR